MPTDKDIGGPIIGPICPIGPTFHSLVLTKPVNHLRRGGGDAHSLSARFVMDESRERP